MSTLEEKARQELMDVGELPDIFDDDDDFEMSGVHEDLAKVNIDPNQQQKQAEEFNVQNPVFLYRMFYQLFFPYKTYTNWLSYDTVPTKDFTHREFSFTLQGDIYARYRSFDSMEELRKDIERMQPLKIDLGAIYAIKPKIKKTVAEAAFKPLEKELVFDIDMTDYDDIRTCCKGGDICRLCWKFIVVAMKIIDTSLEEDFGFKHRLWVYSGRRGVHCWVCDERARKLNNDNRKSIVDYMNVIKGGSQMPRKVRLPQVLHPSLKRSFKVVEDYFEEIILDDMNILQEEEKAEKLLEIIPDNQAKEDIRRIWSPLHDSRQKWDDVVKTLKDYKKRSKDNITRDIMFQYCYPRLDVKVSTGINHLLKSPLCINPKTLKVCVPIKMEDCETFDPMTVPNLLSLQSELDAYNKNPNTDKTVADYKKTSLQPYFEYFDRFVMDLILETKKKKRDEASVSMEF